MKIKKDIANVESVIFYSSFDLARKSWERVQEYIDELEFENKKIKDRLNETETGRLILENILGE